MRPSPAAVNELIESGDGMLRQMTVAPELPDGDYRLGELDVAVKNGRPLLAGTETLAGFTLTLDRSVKVAIAAGVPRETAIAAATQVPATVLGLPYPTNPSTQ